MAQVAGSLPHSPPACSSSCPPAPCRGRRAAGPCTAHIAAVAAPRAPAARPAPRTARSARVAVGGWGTGEERGTSDTEAPGISNPLLTFRPWFWFTQKGQHSLAHVSQVTHTHTKITDPEGLHGPAKPKNWLCLNEPRIINNLLPYYHI